SGANQNRIGRNASPRSDALADVVGDASANRQQVDASDCDLANAVIEYECLRREIVVHAVVGTDAAAISEHREAARGIELYARGAGTKWAHDNLVSASSVALEATLAAAATISSTSRSSPSRHSCGIETIACSNRRSATGQLIASLAEAPASSQALR